jgi:hypothetical protein
MANSSYQVPTLKPTLSKNKTSTVDPVKPKPFSPGLMGHPALKLSKTIEKLKQPGPDSNYLKWSWVLDMHFGTTRVKYIITPSVSLRDNNVAQKASTMFYSYSSLQYEYFHIIISLTCCVLVWNNISVK